MRRVTPWEEKVGEPSDAYVVVTLSEGQREGGKLAASPQTALQL